jgi:hypothetical protein
MEEMEELADRLIEELDNPDEWIRIKCIDAFMLSS